MPHRPAWCLLGLRLLLRTLERRLGTSEACGGLLSSPPGRPKAEEFALSASRSLFYNRLGDASMPARCNCRPPCLRAAPHPPPGTIERLGPLLHAPQCAAPASWGLRVASGARLSWLQRCRLPACKPPGMKRLVRRNRRARTLNHSRCSAAHIYTSSAHISIGTGRAPRRGRAARAAGALAQRQPGPRRGGAGGARAAQGTPRAEQHVQRPVFLSLILHPPPDRCYLKPKGELQAE